MAVHLLDTAAGLIFCSLGSNIPLLPTCTGNSKLAKNLEQQQVPSVHSQPIHLTDILDSIHNGGACIPHNYKVGMHQVSYTKFEEQAQTHSRASTIFPVLI